MKHMRQCYFEVAAGQGKREDAAMIPVLLFLLVSQRGSGWGFAVKSPQWSILLWVARDHAVIIPLGEVSWCCCTMSSGAKEYSCQFGFAPGSLLLSSDERISAPQPLLFPSVSLPLSYKNTLL